MDLLFLNYLMALLDFLLEEELLTFLMVLLVHLVEDFLVSL
jgi:hypothetical protein